MEKWAAYRGAQRARVKRHWWEAARLYVRFSVDQFVEWLCDYGESVPRILASLTLVYVLFILLYGLTGSVVRVQETPAGTVRTPTVDMTDLAVFSVMDMSTSGSPSVGLQPSSVRVHLLTGIQALLGIALTGLLGFVLGSRIRR